MSARNLPTQFRALTAIRLSVKTDETTSPARQRAAIMSEISRRGARAVGEAEDLDVSATKTTPFERPALGEWLKRPDAYDMIVWWRMDRAVRSMADMASLGQWAKEHGKLLVFAEGPDGAPLELDMRGSSPVSELIMMLLAFAAQMEAAAIRERVTGAMAALRAQGRYAGGLIPFGYRKIPNPEGKGWKLAPDAKAVAILERIVREVMDGRSLTAISMDLNAEGIPAPRDYQAKLNGRATGGTRHGHMIERFQWTSGTLSKVLRTPTLTGWRTHKGKPVRNPDGNPVLFGEPVLSADEYQKLQMILASRSNGTDRHRKGTNKALLLGVAHCDGCRGRMYKAARKGFLPGDYVCRATARGTRCPAPSGIRADWLEKYVEQRFLASLGAAKMTRIVEHAGYDPLPELRELEKELRALYAKKDTRRSRLGRAVWEEEVDALERRAAALENTQRTDSHSETIDTGETYAEFWKRSGTDDRRNQLLEAGVRVYVGKGQSGGGRKRLEGPDEARLRFEIEPQASDQTLP